MDTELVKPAQNGDEAAFTSLAAAMADRYLAVSRRILRDVSFAEDATQQALLTV
jgi:DNA-directed RNA polymerase specialized sigma24 family protein